MPTYRRPHRHPTPGEMQAADDEWSERGLEPAHEQVVDDDLEDDPPFHTTGFIEPVDRPRPPASTGSWEDVWNRAPGRPIGWGS